MMTTKLAVTGISLMLLAAAIAPGIQSTYASGPGTPDEICAAQFGQAFPNGIGTATFDTVLVKCFNALDPCFADGVEVKSDVRTTCEFAVIGGSVEGDTVIMQDTIPAEWKIGDDSIIGSPLSCVGLEANTNGQDKSNGKAKENQSATKIECVDNPFNLFGFSVEVDTRESPSGKFFKPTSCGTFEINSGAVLLLGDANGDPVLVEVEPGVFEPIVLAETGPLEVQAVGEGCFI